MWPATAWDDADWEGAEARGWTVMRYLRRRQARLQNEAAEARRRQEEGTSTLRMMTAASMAADAEDAIQARWKGGPNVLAFLFAHPDADAIRTLDSRGRYFNRRSGAIWDLFFPGYYESDNPELEAAAGAEPVGRQFAKDWFFSPDDFDSFREHVEQASGWAYSGGTDLVLVNGWMPEHGPPTVDWQSTLASSLSEPYGQQTLTIPEVVEQITRDLKNDLEDPAYGIDEVVSEPPPVESRLEPTVRELFIRTLGGILGKMGGEALGLK